MKEYVIKTLLRIFRMDRRMGLGWRIEGKDDNSTCEL